MSASITNKKKVLKVPKSSRNTSSPGPSCYATRSSSLSLPSSSPVKSPQKNSLKVSNTSSSSTNIVCSICKGSEALRSMNLESAVSDFNSSIEDYKLLSKSLQDSTSSLDHAVSAIKHFIILIP